MEAVSDGPVPELHTDSEDEEPEEAEEPIEPGDRIFAIGLVPALLGDAPHRPMSPPIFLCHLCIFLLIVASPRRNALVAPILESDDHMM